MCGCDFRKGQVTSPNFSKGIGASVTTFAATAIVVADMVGIGVFTSLGFQVQTIDSGFSLILLWVIGGIVNPGNYRNRIGSRIKPRSG